MRPHKLVMSAFGPFPARTTVDFDLLGNDIYLITGITGAGKTTIFDAIVYALYGKASGNARSLLGGECFHSDFAKDLETGHKDEMLVEFTFSNLEKTYTVSRRIYWGKKGDSKTATKESSLYLGDELIKSGKGLESKDEVTAKIVEILGLDVEQFRKIIMLAQGEFRQFLEANSDKRGEILGKIYDNRRHQDLQARLKAAKLYLDKKDGELVEQAKAQIDLVKIPAAMEEEFSEQIKPDHPELLPSLEAVLEEMEVQKTEKNRELARKEKQEKALGEKKAVAEADNQLLDSLGKKQEELNQLESEKEDIDRLRTAASETEQAGKVLSYENLMKNAEENWKAIVQRIENLTRTGEELNGQLAALEESSKKIQETNLPLISSYHDEKVRLEDALKIYDDLAVKSEDLRKCLQVQKNAAGQVQSAKKNFDDSRQKKAQIEEKLQALEGVSKSSVEIYRLKVKELEDRKKELVKLNEDIDQVKKLTVKRDQLEKKYTKALEDSSTAAGFYSRINDAFIQGQSGILARELISKIEEHGEYPCPVCGVIHKLEDKHNFAEYREEIPTQKDVSAALDKVNEAHTLVMQAGEMFKAKEAELGEKRSVLLGTAEKLIGVNDWDVLKDGAAVDRALQELDGSCENAGAIYKNAEKQLTEKEKAAKDKESIESKIDEAEREWNQAKEALSKADLGVQAAKTAVENWKKQLRDYPETKAEAKKRIDDFGTKADKLTDEIEKEKNQLNACSAAIAENKGNLSQAQESEEASEEARIKAVNDFGMAIEKYGFADVDAYHEALMPEGVKAALDSDRLEKWVKAKKEEIKQYDDKLVACRAAVKALESQAEGKSYVDLSELNEQLNQVKEEKEALKKEERVLDKKLSNNRTAFRNLKKIAAERAECKLALDRIKPLSDTANGSYAFSRYVLNDFFHKITEQANEHLEVMTDGEYSLIATESGDARRTLGLGLKIHNNITGFERETGSLSGGQSFEASLALALGLSDVAQQESASTIQIDSMFIDEGFGSLDGERLDKAVQVLNNLSAGRRQIGIISHVDRLNECIPKKIHVYKDDEKGSRIEIESDV